MTASTTTRATTRANERVSSGDNEGDREGRIELNERREPRCAGASLEALRVRGSKTVLTDATQTGAAIGIRCALNTAGRAATRLRLIAEAEAIEAAAAGRGV
jgi:hypothetical protein